MSKVSTSIKRLVLSQFNIGSTYNLVICNQFHSSVFLTEAIVTDIGGMHIKVRKNSGIEFTVLWRDIIHIEEL